MKKPKKKTKAQLAREAKRARNKAWKELSLKLRTERGRCEVCGEPAQVVHHVLEKRVHLDLWLEEKDLVVLCHRCHFMAHRHRSFEFHAWLAKNKPEQFAWLMDQVG